MGSWAYTFMYVYVNMCANVYEGGRDHIRDYIYIDAPAYTHKPGHPGQYPGQTLSITYL